MFLALGGAALGCAASPQARPAHAPKADSAAAAHPSQPASPASPASPPAITAAVPRESASSLDGRPYFGDQAACFVLFDLGRQAWTISDKERCSDRFLPFSTFKIPNALIGLETGVLKDASSKIAWDSERYPAEDWWPKEWQQTLDLRQAMAFSAVPYFRAMALRVGEAAMQRHLTAFGYGNARLGGALDAFWLNGELAISGMEQVRFLSALAQGTLPVSARAMDIVKDVLVLNRGDGYVVHGKTGTGTLHDGQKLGWFVGFVEVEAAQGPGKQDGRNVFVFALNISGATFEEIPRAERAAVTSRILVDLGVLPKGTAIRLP